MLQESRIITVQFRVLHVIKLCLLYVGRAVSQLIHLLKKEDYVGIEINSFLLLNDESV